jgi:hypothetical protein
LTLVLLAASSGLFAQTSSSNFASPSSSMPGASQSTASPVSHGAVSESPAPFSRLALSGGIGLGGINMQAAVNANRYLNIRGVGNYFSYSVNNIKVGGSGSSGSDVSGTLNFAEGGVALDYFPWPNHGFRLSPGVTFYNQNGASATGAMAPGSSITLGSDKFYSEAANPIELNAKLGLNTHKQAFTMTTGWGNLISRKGGHFSVPFEIGAIFTGAPTLGLNITGYGCDSKSDAQNNVAANCVNMSGTTSLPGYSGSPQSDIAAQIAKYQKDLNPLKVYPILSIGIGYNFKIR